MQPIRTLEDLIHAVTNSLSRISIHSQYLLAKRAVPEPASEDLGIICDEVERAAGLLRLVPRELARANIQETVDPPVG
jgi:hypothetical protein